jgi:hypothetical protein
MGTCGEIVSSISEAMGIPMCVKSQNNFLEILKPLLILKLPSMSGSLINPFHPTVVLYSLVTIAGRGYRFLEVRSHDNEQIIFKFVRKRFQTLCVFESCSRVMN